MKKTKTMSAEEFTKAVNSQFPFHEVDGKFEHTVSTPLYYIPLLKSEEENEKVYNYLRNNLKLTITVQAQDAEPPKGTEYRVAICYTVLYRNKAIGSHFKQIDTAIDVEFINVFLQNAYHCPTAIDKAVAEHLIDNCIISKTAYDELSDLWAFLTMEEIK
jgi:hypothetical protein